MPIETEVEMGQGILIPSSDAVRAILGNLELTNDLIGGSQVCGDCAACGVCGDCAACG